MKKIINLFIISLLATALVGCSKKESIEKYDGAYIIDLNKESATLNGEKIEEFDYTFNIDPSHVHDDVKDSPAVYYTGSKNETDAVCYIDHDLIYYPELDEDDFCLVNYDGEREWAYYYKDGVNNDYIFSTLPMLGETIPKYMMHSSQEASENKVLHIAKEGTYVLQGEWLGQINIDLGDVFSDESAKVKLILNGVNINCTVAPAIMFKSVYEVDNTWEDREGYSGDADINGAGATVVIADNSTNTVTGNNVFRILKTKYKNDDSNEAIKTQKKAYKYDGAFYSCMSMKIESEKEESGILEINSCFEGLDSELHLLISGGNITINSNDDGINVNEDLVSSVLFDGGNIIINAALGTEGDGIDSNGFVVINDGLIEINNVRVPDAPIDSECGINYRGGSIIVDGSPIDVEYGTYNEIGNNRFSPTPRFEDDDFIHDRPMDDFDIVEFKKKVSELSDDATIQDVMELLGNRQNGFRFNDMPNNPPMGDKPR